MRNPTAPLITHLNLLGSDEERTVRDQWRFHIDLNFFGTDTRLHVRSSKEEAQWRYFFKHFVTDNDRRNVPVEIWVGVDGSDASFIESIFTKDFKCKSVYVAQAGHFELWVRFDRWSEIRAPLPPFSLPPLNEQVALFGGGSIVPSGAGGAVMFLAPPYQGKSTLVNALVLDGGTPLSDNLTVVDAKDLKILPYLTPTGIRAETASRLPALERAITLVPPDRITLSEVTGPVYLLHFDDITQHPIPKSVSPKLIIYLVNKRGGEAGGLTFGYLDKRETRHLLSKFYVDNGMRKANASELLNNLADHTTSVVLQYDLLATPITRLTEVVLKLLG